MAKIQNFHSFGGCIPTFLLRQMWNLAQWHRGRAKFHIYGGNVLPLRGKKFILGTLSKNNTGMTALCAGLPVNTQINVFASKTGFLLT